jgi:hypothetical protein
MPDYANGKIYKIWSPSTDLTYIGSTCNKLHIRLFEHRADFKRYKAGKYCYVTSFYVLEQPDHRILLIEDFPCQNRAELNRREGEIIQAMTCVNKHVAGRTNKEYCKKYDEEHRDEKNEYNKKYRETHKDELKKQHTCTCGGKYTTVNKSQHTKSKKHQAWLKTQ